MRITNGAPRIHNRRNRHAPDIQIFRMNQPNGMPVFMCGSSRGLEEIAQLKITGIGSNSVYKRNISHHFGFDPEKVELRIVVIPDLFRINIRRMNAFDLKSQPSAFAINYKRCIGFIPVRLDINGNLR